MDFLENENFPLFSIRILRNAGHNVSSVSEDLSGAKDIMILKCAYEEKLIILTFDRDYGELIGNSFGDVGVGELVNLLAGKLHFTGL